MMKKNDLYHKILKAFLCLWICGILMWAQNICAEAEGAGLESFGADITTDDGNLTYTVKWWRQDGFEGNDYYMTLPYDARETSVRIRMESHDDVYLDGVKISEGDELPQLAGGHHQLMCSGIEYSLYVIYGSDIPTIHITTRSGSMEKVYEDITYKEPGYAVVLSEGEVVCEGELAHIKGRGNYTWTRRKRPFNIKFKKKQNLFDMGAAKKWTLLANYLDDTMLKNKLGYDLAEKVGLQFSPQSQLVDLYIDGEYIGNYTLSESIEVQESRVDITDLEELNELANPETDLDTLEPGGVRGADSYLEFGSSKWVELPNDPEVISGGYLLEFELDARYDEELCGFVSEYGQTINLKSPEHASKAQVEYISSYYQEFEDAVLSGDGRNALGKHYSEYIDVESFAKMYVFQEYVKNLDAGLSSFYVYKEVGGCMTAGAVWDLDSAFGRETERDGVRMDDPESLWVTGSHLHGNVSEKYTLFSLLCRHNDFREEAKRQWKEYFAPNTEWLLSNLDTLSEQCFTSIFTDKFKWIIEESYSEAYEQTAENISTLRTFLVKRSEYLSKIFSGQSCVLEYHSNGGDGLMTDLTFYEKDTTVILQENSYTKDGRKFLGWNTKASGWGKSYEDGAELTLDKDTTLYAQWEKTTFKEKLESFLLGITGN